MHARNLVAFLKTLSPNLNSKYGITFPGHVFECNTTRFTPDACHNSGRFLQQLYANGHDGGDGRDGGRCREGLQLGRAVRRENEVNPARSTPEGSRLPAGEAQVEAEEDEVTLPVREPMTATTL
jgi:hypothetical protein